MYRYANENENQNDDDIDIGTDINFNCSDDTCDGKFICCDICNKWECLHQLREYLTKNLSINGSYSITINEQMLDAMNCKNYLCYDCLFNLTECINIWIANDVLPSKKKLDV